MFHWTGGFILDLLIFFFVVMPKGDRFLLFFRYFFDVEFVPEKSFGLLLGNFADGVLKEYAVCGLPFMWVDAEHDF